MARSLTGMIRKQFTKFSSFSSQVLKADHEKFVLLHNSCSSYLKMYLLCILYKLKLFQNVPLEILYNTFNSTFWHRTVQRRVSITLNIYFSWSKYHTFLLFIRTKVLIGVSRKITCFVFKLNLNRLFDVLFYNLRCFKV